MEADSPVAESSLPSGALDDEQLIECIEQLEKTVLRNAAGLWQRPVGQKYLKRLFYNVRMAEQQVRPSTTRTERKAQRKAATKAMQSKCEIRRQRRVRAQAYTNAHAPDAIAALLGPSGQKSGQQRQQQLIPDQANVDAQQCSSIQPPQAGDSAKRRQALLVDDPQPLSKRTKPLSSSKSPDHVQTLPSSFNCYVCKAPSQQLYIPFGHETPFYDSLCVQCAELNFRKRSQTRDLTGHWAIVTGGRIKIGFETAVMLLQANATVIVTSRFPQDAALRYQQHADFDRFKDRLHIIELDLLHQPSVHAFVTHVKDMLGSSGRLDILVNNAAQTIRRPRAYYSKPEQNEQLSLPIELASVLQFNNQFKLKFASQLPQQRVPSLPSAALELMQTSTSSSQHTQVGDPSTEKPVSDATTEHECSILDSSATLHAKLMNETTSMIQDDRFVDQSIRNEHDEPTVRGVYNTWNQPLVEVPLTEMYQVHQINFIAPTYITQQLLPVMMNGPRPAYIINASAVEGKFSAFKTGFHPHTNAAKAALNMFTRTVGQQLAQSNVFMNAVDTGWVTIEYPAEAVTSVTSPPLDEIDGAARLLDPIFVKPSEGGQPPFAWIHHKFQQLFDACVHCKWVCSGQLVSNFGSSFRVEGVDCMAPSVLLWRKSLYH
eukprot:TRINITY_DN9078_c0_g2_i2.p1 TRINITY_DN9078_c0_g2~~TRINITY_DN9078_c0_g2_i2.p1  ORF type:complete len:720 (+),score=97.63 TRINITY_DN9078_c0_g2_i2:188-2161(+)